MTNWWLVATSITSAAATIGAVGLALWVAIRDGEQRDEERRDSEAAQARLVMHSYSDTPGRVIITNHSAAPIIDVYIQQVSVIYEDGHRRTPELSGYPSLPASRGSLLHPGEDWFIPWSLKYGYGPSGQKLQIECTYQFLDARGLVWERRNNGQPIRVIKSPVSAG